jgi:hypothetical protein
MAMGGDSGGDAHIPASTLDCCAMGWCRARARVTLFLQEQTLQGRMSSLTQEQERES